MNKTSLPQFLILLTLPLVSCVHTNYSGDLPPSDVYEVEAVAGAQLGERGSGITMSHRYFGRGRYRAGPVSLEVATESGIDPASDEEDSDMTYQNLRTIKFSGVGGHRYQLRPLPASSSAKLLGVMALDNRYEGYELLNLTTRRIVLRVP